MTMTNNSNKYHNINVECACFNLRKITRAVTQFFDRHLESSGLRATQFTLLVNLAAGTSKTLTEMADSLVMDRTTLTRNLRPLEKLGFITTTKVSDRRSKAYVLTDAGTRALEKGVPLWQQAQSKILNQFGNERYKRTVAELDAMRAVASLPRVTRKKDNVVQL
ncbi:MAG: MarR family winged helix-turn-helix transcriptional regulator [Gammaproteobacteria bacterium]